MATELVALNCSPTDFSLEAVRREKEIEMLVTWDVVCPEPRALVIDHVDRTSRLDRCVALTRETGYAHAAAQTHDE